MRDNPIIPMRSTAAAQRQNLATRPRTRPARIAASTPYQQNEARAWPLGKLYEFGATPKKATGRRRWKAYFNATSSVNAPSMVINRNAAIRMRRKWIDTQIATKYMVVTAATDPRNENTCIQRVSPGVASWWTAVRTRASN